MIKYFGLVAKVSSTFPIQNATDKCGLTLGSSLIKAYWLFCQVRTWQREACDHNV